MGSAVERTDEHVREYLIYRGFTNTLKHLDHEIKADKEKGFRVDKIIEQLQLFVQSFDLFGLKEYWLYLDRRLFCRLEDVYGSTVNKLRTSLYRYYVINTIQRGNLEKTQEFFQKQASELQTQAEWRDWFVLPFVPAPEQNSAFAPYFSRQWADTFLVSLHNFLSVLFQCVPQPVLLSFDAEVQKMTSLSEENEQYRQMVKTPVLLTLGEDDKRVPNKQGVEYYKALKAKQIPVRLLWYPGNNHSLSKVDAESDGFMNIALWIIQHLRL